MAAPGQDRAGTALLRVDVVVEQLRRPLPGGIGTYCRGLLQGLAALGAAAPEVRLFASRPPARDDPLAALGFPLRTSLLPARLLTRAWDRGLPLGWLGGSGAGLVHGTSFATPGVPQLPLSVMVHDLAWRRHPEAYPARGRRWHEAALRRLAKRADAFLVPSALTEDDLLGAGLGIAPERVHVVAEGLDHLPPPDHAAARELLAGLGVGPSGCYLLSIGTLEPRKNLSRLVAAYGMARRRLPEPWPLVVVGPRGWGEAGPLGQEGVLVAGPVSGGTLSALLAGARCLCYVPLLEGFGLPAGEGLAAGTPVVASRGMPSSAGAALEVDPGDEEEIAAGMVTAASDEEARQRLRAAGGKRAAELTWEAAAQEHVLVWRALAGRGR